MIELYDRIEVNEIVVSLTQKYLRHVNKYCTELSGKKRELFHSIVANLLFSIYRGKHDL